MAPYLLLGVVIAGVMHVLIPSSFIARQLGRAGLGPVAKAAAFGVPLPLCSCSVVPVAASLTRSGASRGAVVSFLVTTPTSGVDSILATYSLLGLPIAIIRVIGSFLIGLAAGVATALGTGVGSAETTTAGEEAAAAGEGSWLRRTLRYGFEEVFGGIARPLLIGTLLGGAIAYFLPAGILEQYVGQGFLSYLVMLAVGIPLYVCASGSIPLAAALMLKGISPGAALVFLIAGPATNAATVTVISGMLGKRTLVIYLLFLMLGSLAVGYGTDAFFASFPALAPSLGAAAGHHHEQLGLLELASGIALGALTLFHVGRPLVKRLRRSEPEAGGLIFEVPDMNCQHCVASVTKAVDGLPGVVEIDADPDTKRLVLEGDGSADPTAVLEAITAAGFHPRRLEPDTSAT